jgi:hypothetical protein
MDAGTEKGESNKEINYKSVSSLLIVEDNRKK